MSTPPQAGLGRRIGRQLLTLMLAVLTLGVGAFLTWASLAAPRPELGELSVDPDMLNDLPANLSWLLLIGIAVVSWRQIAVGVVTAIACAGMVLAVAYTEVGRYGAIGEAGTTRFLIYLTVLIEAGAFVAVGIATGLFGWHQRSKLRSAESRD
ncbi:MAG TPA: hypothetical protein VIP98_04570 [Microlunatus sp.]